MIDIKMTSARAVLGFVLPFAVVLTMVLSGIDIFIALIAALAVLVIYGMILGAKLKDLEKAMANGASAVIGAVYDSGIKHFICGMALGCDMYCAEAVIRLKKMHSDVTLQAAVPYRGQADNWNEYNRLRYDRIIDNCDEVTVLAESYSPACMAIRNRFMVDNSSVLVACYDGMSGGTWNTIRYAQKKDIEVIQLPIE